MKVRPVAAADLAEWIRMRTALWPDAPGDHPVESAAYLARPGDSTLVLVVEETDGSLSGFLEAGTRPYAEGCVSTPVGYVEGWWVEPAYRRRGRGAALIRAAEAWAARRGLTEMASDADLGNEVSHTAHRSLGYEESQRIVCFRKSLRDTS